MNSPTDCLDPVARLIASKLRIMERNGFGKLLMHPDGRKVRVGFGPLAVTAEDVDIAMIRLGSRLMDEPSLSRAFVSAIGAEMKKFCTPAS